MKGKNVHRAGGRWNSRYTLCILVILILLAGVGLGAARQAVLNNARLMGKNLVQGYAADEVQNIDIYEKMLTFGLSGLQEKIDQGADSEEIRAWLLYFFRAVEKLGGEESADAYAAVAGMVIAANPWPDYETYDYEQAEWYRKAMQAEGQVIFTDAYADEVDGRRVVTIAIADPDTGNAIAFDLPPEHFRTDHRGQALPEKSAYYVCDSSGTLLYYATPFDLTEEQLEPYVRNIYDRIEAGTLGGGNNMILGVNQERRGVYYYRAQNGWLCILTLPYATLLQDLYTIYLWCTVLFALFSVFAVFLWIRERRLDRNIEHTNETIQVLGNTFYAVYRVNLADGTYEMTKGSDYVRERLPYKGKYTDLVRVLAGVMDEETGKEFAKSFAPEHVRELNWQQKESFGGDFLRQFDGIYQWVNVRLLFDPLLGPDEAVMSFQRIDEEKKRQFQHIQLIEDALAAAEASEKSQIEFYAQMSHNMRTPLNIIIGMTDSALRADSSREKQIDCLQKIGDSGREMLGLVNEVLEASRLKQGQVSLENRTFDLCDTLAACVKPFQKEALAQGKELLLRTEAAEPVVRGDSLRLTQILNNLLSNAVKFTGPGDQITVSLRQAGQQRQSVYLFTVEDTGAGMSEEFLQKVFMPYSREMRFGMDPVSGSGLGMSMVKSLVSQMGGQIAVESTQGKGTCVTVTLPFEPENRVEAADCSDTESGSLEGKHILVVEDNPLNLEITAELLDICGMQVTSAANGREALEIFREAEQYQFDGILMDIQMPEMDGCTASAAIRALDRPDAGTIPIIALTANTFAEDIARTAEAGMNAHLAKPIDMDKLYAVLEKYISGCHHTDR